MRNAAATGRRRVRHDRDGRALKQLRQIVFGYVSEKLDAFVSGTLGFHRLDVALCLRMVATRNHKPRFRHLLGQQIEGLDHQFQALVCAPLSERENAVKGIAAAREIGEFRPSGQDAMRTEMNIVAPVLVIQDLAIARHQHRD